MKMREPCVARRGTLHAGKFARCSFRFWKLNNKCAQAIRQWSLIGTLRSIEVSRFVSLMLVGLLGTNSLIISFHLIRCQ